VEPFVQLAMVSGAPDPQGCAQEARSLLSGRLPDEPLAAATRVKRILARSGFRDDALAFTLPDMLARRGGNCLGLTLFVGAALMEHGHDVRFALRLDPFDDVHDAGVERFQELCDPDGGVDEGSRLPGARDCTSRFRFVPVEHASLVLPGGQPFEPTGLGDPDADPEWAPDSEAVREVDFARIATMVLSERAKSAAREGAVRPALRLLLRALRAWPGNREALGEMWRVARACRRDRLASAAAIAYVDIGGDDSLYWYTRYLMTGDEACLAGALERLPSYAEAYLDQHVRLPLTRGSEEPGALRRHLAIVAWMIAESEILDLEQLYRRDARLFASVFSQRQLETVLASFAGSGRDVPRSQR